MKEAQYFYPRATKEISRDDVLLNVERFSALIAVQYKQPDGIMTKEKRAIVVGASSGIGYEVACELLREGWHVGLAARRTEKFDMLAAQFSGQVCYASIDITQEGAEKKLLDLVGELDGMNLYLHVAGVGWQNLELQPDKELLTVNTNAMGFTRMVGAVYRYLAAHGGGHIAVVSSIAGTKGLGVAPAYSASKAFCNVYIEALEQQAHIRHLPIYFTDLRPGFVKTDLLGDGKRYPMLMPTDLVAKNIIKAIKSHRHICIIDWRYRILTALWRLIPRCLWRRLAVRN